MFELSELRKIANSDGGPTMTLSDCRQTDTSEGVFVLGEAAFAAKRTAPPFEAASNGSATRDRVGRVRAGGSLDPADTRGARLVSLSSSDRDVFNRWATWVIALYSLLVLGLATAMLFGVRAAADRGALTSSSAAEPAPADASIAAPGRTGK